MHPYQLASVLAERGVPANRGSLYNTIEAMARAGWIEPREPERSGGRPQRIPYSITSTGRSELVRRLDQQIRMPHREFPEFLGAVSHIGVLGSQRAVDALRERAQRLDSRIADDQRRLDEVMANGAVPRLFLIEAEYALAMLRAERTWVLATIKESDDHRLTWPSSPQEHQEGTS